MEEATGKQQKNEKNSGKVGVAWSVPYSLSAGRVDVDKGDCCIFFNVA